MSSDHNPSAADEKELQEKEERACQIEELKKRIEGLENVNKKLADQNLELLRAYEQQRFGVPSGVGDTNDPTREFERLGIQESVENFHQKEKEVDSLNAKCEMLEKANLNLTEENKKLTKDLEHNKKLNTKSKKVAIFNVTLQAENKMLRKTLEHYKDVEKDYKDGANMAEEKKIPNQGRRLELAGFRNPFNCAVSCVPSVVFFIFYKMKLRVCNKRFIIEMHCTLCELPGEVCEVGNCSLSFKDFYNVGIIEETRAFSKQITDTDEIDSYLQEAIETMDGELHPALFVMKYKEEQDGTKRAGHCVAIMPNGKFIDVQKERHWEPKQDPLLKSINQIEVWKVGKKGAKEWEEKCALKKCEIECIVCTSDPSAPML